MKKKGNNNNDNDYKTTILVKEGHNHLQSTDRFQCPARWRPVVPCRCWILRTFRYWSLRVIEDPITTIGCYGACCTKLLLDLLPVLILFPVIIIINCVNIFEMRIALGYVKKIDKHLIFLIKRSTFYENEICFLKINFSYVLFWMSHKRANTQNI